MCIFALDLIYVTRTPCAPRPGFFIHFIFFEAWIIDLCGLPLTILIHDQNLKLIEPCLAVSAKKVRIAYESGRRAVELANEGVNSRSIITREAIENAMAMDMALGGSTNFPLHILGLANDAEVDIDITLLDEVSKKIPHVVNIRPGIFSPEDSST